MYKYDKLTTEVFNKVLSELFNTQSKEREYVFYVFGSKQEQDAIDAIDAQLAFNKEVYDRITRKDSNP